MRTGGWYSVTPDKVTACKRCGCGGLAWHASKSGKMYLCHVRRVHSDYTEAYWVMPNSPHSCAEYRDRVAKETAAKMAREEAGRLNAARTLTVPMMESYLKLLDDIQKDPMNAKALVAAWAAEQPDLHIAGDFTERATP